MVTIQRSTTTTAYLPQSNLLFGFAGAPRNGEPAVLLNANSDQPIPAPMAASGDCLYRRGSNNINPTIGGLGKLAEKQNGTTGLDTQINTNSWQNLRLGNVLLQTSNLSEHKTIWCRSPWRQVTP